MSNAAVAQQMTAEEFELWHQTQDERYEFVDGFPQLKFASWDGTKMMTDASNGHNMIVSNVHAACATGLRDKSCRAYAADGKVRIPKGNIRYPDVSIDCGPFDRKASHLANPVAVIEVLSKGTYWLDQNRKLFEYQSVPSIQQILLLSQDEMRGQMWLRTPQGWAVEDLNGPEASAEFPPVELRFSLAVAYAGALEEE